MRRSAVSGYKIPCDQDLEKDKGGQQEMMAGKGVQAVACGKHDREVQDIKDDDRDQKGLAPFKVPPAKDAIGEFDQKVRDRVIDDPKTPCGFFGKR